MTALIWITASRQPTPEVAKWGMSTASQPGSHRRSQQEPEPRNVRFARLSSRLFLDRRDIALPPTRLFSFFLREKKRLLVGWQSADYMRDSRRRCARSSLCIFRQPEVPGRPSVLAMARTKNSKLGPQIR